MGFGVSDNVPNIDRQPCDHDPRAKLERIRRLLLDDVEQGLDDVVAGRVVDARGALLAAKRRRTASNPG